MKTLAVQPLTAAVVAPFGTLIEAAAVGDPINGGSARRHEAVPALDLQRDSARAVLAVYDAQARRFPFVARTLERHRLSDQIFLPLGGARRCVLLLAAPHLAHPKAADCVALLSNGRQGVRIAAGTWHHGLLALDHGPWAVLERRGETVDCDELVLDVPLTLTVMR